MQHKIDECGEESRHGNELHPALTGIKRHARADERQDAQHLVKPTWFEITKAVNSTEDVGR